MQRAMMVGILVLMMLTPVLNSKPYVGATDSGLVILTTDNEADMAVAYSVGSLLNAPVIVSPWGTYDPRVSAEILSADPERVIIIGGPVAVPDDYTDDLQGFGIPYERWYGETRYETNLQVVEHLREEFPGVLSNVGTVVVINGRDALALKSYAEGAMLGTEGRSLLVLTDSGRVEETMKALGELGKVERLVYIGTSKNGKPLFPLNEEWLSDFARGRFGNLTIEMRAGTPGPIELGEFLKKVGNKTREAQALLDGLQIPSARGKLKAAKELEIMAESAYASGDYYRAYELAMKANWDVDFAIARAYRETMTIYQGSATLMLRRKLAKLETIAEFLKGEGYNVSEVEDLIQRALNALNKGNYQMVLNDLLPQIRKDLAVRARMGRKVAHGKYNGPSKSPGGEKSHGGRG
ncbi:hypothetical protein [Thermococcus sp.]|uniref:cell wall-binding repeat-containing protein n=1 Tax=Thermococcus sp. TaxID=35749 RepID=UPI00262B208A|nr:hypothetical protein [Thermococcus sp.]